MCCCELWKFKLCSALCSIIPVWHRVLLGFQLKIRLRKETRVEKKFHFNLIFFFSLNEEKIFFTRGTTVLTHANRKIVQNYGKCMLYSYEILCVCARKTYECVNVCVWWYWILCHMKVFNKNIVFHLNENVEEKKDWNEFGWNVVLILIYAGSRKCGYRFLYFLGYSALCLLCAD